MQSDPLAQIITPRDYHRKNPRWYHTHIIDWMMANPNGKLSDCAAFVGKTQPTLSAIIRSDLFQAALEKRKAEFSAQQDLIIKQKLTQVSIASLDQILGVIDKKRGTIPLETLNSVADSALKRLGYGLEQKAQPTAVQVNVHQNNVAVPISSAELDAARSLLRQNQQRLASGIAPVDSDQAGPPPAGSAPTTDVEAPLGGAGNRLDQLLNLSASDTTLNLDTRLGADTVEPPAAEQRKEDSQ